MKQGFVPCEDDKPKCTEITLFQAGSDYSLSASMAGKIFDSVTEFNKTAAKKKEEYEEKLRTLITEKHFSHKRFIKAFPSISSKRFGKALEKLKKHINKH